MDVSPNENFKSHKRGVSDASGTTFVGSETDLLCHSPTSPNPPGRERRRSILWAWKWEVVAILVSVGAFLTTVGLLTKFNGKEQPTWPSAVNLNTIVSISSLLIRATLMAVVAESISQARWRWFNEKERPLKDLDVFEDASRGFLGSLKLLLTSWKPNLVMLGAAIAISAIAIDPFSQQALKTYVCESSLGSHSSMPVAQYVDGTDIVVTKVPGAVFLSTPMKGAVANGFLAAEYEGSQVNPTCATGNCTWSEVNGITYSSMGFCRKCADITSSVTASRMIAGAYNYSVGATSIQRAPAWVPWISVASEPIPYELIRNNRYHGTINSTILSFTHASCVMKTKTSVFAPGTQWEKNDTQTVWDCPQATDRDFYLQGDVDIIAANCTLYPCLRNYRGVVTNGVLREQLVSTEPADTSGEEYIVDSCTEEEADSCQYGMNSSVVVGIHGFLESTLKGTCKYNQDMYSDRSQRAECLESAWTLDSLYHDGNTSMEVLDKAYGNLATAMSNRMRSVGKAFDRVSAGVTPGVAHQSTVCIRFDWRWLILPATLIIMSILLLAIMIIQSWSDRDRQPVWKSSLLPFLFYGVQLPHHDQEYRDSSKYQGVHEKPMPLKHMRREADKIMVTFRNDDKRGSGFVVEDTRTKAAESQRKRESHTSVCPTLPEMHLEADDDSWDEIYLSRENRSNEGPQVYAYGDEVDLSSVSREEDYKIV